MTHEPRPAPAAVPHPAEGARERRAPTRSGSHGTTTTTATPYTTHVAARLVLGTLVALALLPPALWLGVGWWQVNERLQADAARVIWARGELAAAGPLSSEHVRVHEGNGRVLAERGAAAAWPAQQLRAALEPGAQAPGSARSASVASAPYLQAETSLRPLLTGMLLAALAGAALAFSLWRWAYRRPMLALGQAERRIHSQARLDNLTGLLNREGLRERLHQALARHGNRGATAGLLVIDIDRFARVNTTLGQSSGDLVLRAVADRMRAVTRVGDALARVAGDQFALVVERIHGTQVLAAMARNLQRAFDEPFLLDGREIVITLSVGGMLAGGEHPRPDLLLREATAAMRTAKAAGGGRYRLYDAAMQDLANDGLGLELDLRLRRALAAGQFFLMYQPIVDARSHEVVAVEALLRWADPERGVVSPADFIPVLEQTGLIVPVGQWVLREACRRGRQWMNEGAGRIVLSVNLSPRQFAEADFLARLAATLRETDFPATQLQLEVTEGLLLGPTPETLRRIDALAAMGVRLAVDDFGMGYSSLAYLKRFKLHTLKIDRLFVRDVARQGQDLAIVRAIVDLGHGLGMSVTAEGVETEAQCHELRRLGCDSLQGYLFARPTLPSEVKGVAPMALTAAPQPPAPAGAAPAVAPTSAKAQVQLQPA